MKRCPACQHTLPLTAFAGDRSRRDGHMNRCKDCDKARAKAYYTSHRADRLAKAKARQAATRTPRPPQPRQPRTPAKRALTAHIAYYGCHRCHNSHVAGRCRITKTRDQLHAMTDRDMDRWAAGHADYLWTADDWAIHTIAQTMGITGTSAQRLATGHHG